MPHPTWFWALASFAFCMFLLALEAILLFVHPRMPFNDARTYFSAVVPFSLGLGALIWAAYLQGWLS